LISLRGLEMRIGLSDSEPEKAAAYAPLSEILPAARAVRSVRM